MEPRSLSLSSPDKAEVQRYLVHLKTFETVRAIADFIINELEIQKRYDHSISFKDARMSEPLVSLASKQGIALLCENMLPVALVTPWGKWRFLEEACLESNVRQKIAVSLQVIMSLNRQDNSSEIVPVIHYKDIILPIFKMRKEIKTVYENRLHLAEWNYFILLKKRHAAKSLIFKKLVARL